MGGRGVIRSEGATREARKDVDEEEAQAESWTFLYYVERFLSGNVERQIISHRHGD